MLYENNSLSEIFALYETQKGRKWNTRLRNDSFGQFKESSLSALIILEANHLSEINAKNDSENSDEV